MSDAQAGTPAVPAESSPKAENQQANAQDGSGLNAQQQKEWLTLKQKAEDYNKLQREAEELRARLAATEQMFNTANRATDPMIELRSTLAAQAEYDPASKAALIAMAQNERMAAELWLSDQLLAVPAAKRDRVAALIRNAGYQMSAEHALSLVTDPEAKSLADKLAEAERELERLRTARPNGSSPSTTTPATSSASDSVGASPREIKRSEYIERLKAGGPEARALMESVGSNKTKLVDD